MTEALRDSVADEIETALDAAAMPWGRRGDDWVIPAGEGMPRELRIRIEDGARVEAALLEWDEITDESHEALALFLAVARAGLRGCRGELDDTSARLVAVLDGESLEAELPRGLHGVAAGCRRMAREARALLIPSLARAYLAFQRRGTD